MRVLVTGANGHIGANVVRALLAKGHQVRAFTRKGADLRGLEGLQVEHAHGDVMNEAGLIEAATDCDAIIHLAAVYKTIASNPDEIVQPAIQGAENIFKAAKQANIKRIVYTSSVASVGFSYDKNKLRNGSQWNEDPQNPYYIAKTKSEQKAQELAKAFGIHTVVICPAIVVGGYDYRVTPSNQLVMDWINGKGQTYKGGLNLVDVRDVAQAHVEALDKGNNCQRYIVGGENIEVKKVGELVKLMTGIKPIHLPFGRKATLVTARFVETICKLFGITPPFTYDLVYEVSERYAYYDLSDTISDLNLKPRPAQESLASAIDWLLKTNKIKHSISKSVRAHFEDYQNRTKK